MVERNSKFFPEIRFSTLVNTAQASKEYVVRDKNLERERSPKTNFRHHAETCINNFKYLFHTICLVLWKNCSSFSHFSPPPHTILAINYSAQLIISFFFFHVYFYSFSVSNYFHSKKCIIAFPHPTTAFFDITRQRLVKKRYTVAYSSFHKSLSVPLLQLSLSSPICFVSALLNKSITGIGIRFKIRK
jgi:hypothetical protein